MNILLFNSFCGRSLLLNWCVAYSLKLLSFEVMVSSCSITACVMRHTVMSRLINRLNFVYIKYSVYVYTDVFAQGFACRVNFKFISFKKKKKKGRTSLTQFLLFGGYFWIKKAKLFQEIWSLFADEAKLKKNDITNARNIFFPFKLFFVSG